MRRRINRRNSAAYLIIAAALLSMAGPPWSLAGTPFEAAHKFIESGQLTEARRALESELRIRPENIEARYNLAVLLQEIGHEEEAASLYRNNLRRFWHLPSLINLAMLLDNKGAHAQAREWLEKGTKKIKHESAPWYLLAAISERNGKNVQAASQYQKAIKADPLNGFSYIRYADFQSRHGLADGGLKHAGKAVRLLPECAPCWRTYGDILHRAKKENEALAAYQRSLAINPAIETRQQLVLVLRKLGQNKRAEHIQQGIDAWKKHQDN